MPAIPNRRRELFAQELAACTPQATAYVLVGFKDSKWARFNASKLAHDPVVAARVRELQNQFADRAGLQAAYIQRQLLPLVEANPKDLYNADGSLRPIVDLPRELAKAVKKVKLDPKTGRVVEITLHSPTEAGNLLLRSIGGMVEGGQEPTLLDLINASYEVGKKRTEEAAAALSDAGFSSKAANSSKAPNDPPLIDE
jgi:hypothetical protein